VVAALLSGSGAALAVCVNPGAPTDAQTKCLTAVLIPGNPLRSFDISWVNSDRAEYYLGDRSNAGVDVIDTAHNIWKRRLPGFTGVALKAGAVDNNHSGPDGVTSFGRWVYAGDGDSTLKVFDLTLPIGSPASQIISTGGTTRVDEMALTTDGRVLLAANNAEDPPFATLFLANGNDGGPSHVAKLNKISVDPKIIPPTFGLSLEQPAWDQRTRRYYVSIPVIANNPTGCNYGQLTGAITCDGGLLVIDPASPTSLYGAYDPSTNTGVVSLTKCGPNGATVGLHDDLLLGCTPQNNPSDTDTLVINAKTKNYTLVGNITGSDEVWFNKGDRRYYLGASREISGAALGVVDGTSVLIETIPQSTGSHSVAADSQRNYIYVPQVAPVSVVGSGGDTTTVGAGICGGTNGCVAVFVHHVDDDDQEADADFDHHDHDR